MIIRMGKIKEMEEFEIIKCKEKNLNKEIDVFRQEHPNYEIFTISAFGTGGAYGGTLRYCVIWRERK